MDWDHVIRALDLRQINNPSDISMMLLFVYVVTITLFLLVFYLNYDKKYWSYIALSAFFAATVLIQCNYSFKVFMYNAPLVEPHEMSMLKLFYLCDGVIILLAYSYQVSYEAMNLILFFVIQPTIIVLLFWRAICLQLKLKRYEQSTDITDGWV